MTQQELLAITAASILGGIVDADINYFDDKLVNRSINLAELLINKITSKK